MVGLLARHETAAVLAVKPCKQLKALLRHQNIGICESAAAALYSIIGTTKGAQAAVDAHVLDYMSELLESSDTDIQRWTWGILGQLGLLNPVAMLAAANPCARLVALLRISDRNDTLSSVVLAAGDALSRIARSPEGAQAIVNAKVLEYLEGLLQSWNSRIRQFACHLLGSLAVHETTAVVVLTSISCCNQLVSLLQSGRCPECGRCTWDHHPFGR
ncbi:armadillo-type protein [Mycena latifolia]|nr:armadillo-type protein [Mycena latifolia]